MTKHKHGSPCGHRATAAKRNLFGSRRWWVTCTCGDKQGWHLKQDALAYRDAHLARRCA